MSCERIRISTIESVSPTLAETLRQCKLRAGLSLAEGSGHHVLGNPKAWLGTAYHAVLEQVGPEHQDNIEKIVKDLWDAAIEAQYERSRAHHFNKRFGPPDHWPGYHMVAAMAIVRAKELIATAPGSSGSCSNGQSGNRTFREKKFSSANGKLIGRPDAVRSDEVVDFKTGDVFEDEEPQQVKAAYVRQLRLYAFLVKETLGWWPRQGVLLPMAGSRVAITLDADECEAEAVEAIGLLDEYNELISQTQDPIDLASPSSAACQWCQYQLYCPAFWGAVGLEWEWDSGSAAVEGIALGSASPIYAGTAVSISFQVERGTQPAGGRLFILPLHCSVHAGLETVQKGDRLRATGLWRRPDGSVVPSIWTMIAAEANLPFIVVAP